mmetsp:Transcript_45451/g.75844  ORF Transcript_45451/g.75844 Transcript_45451/m.75844 type:complete len:91 (+) Transcript_45451:2-274(+)
MAALTDVVLAQKDEPVITTVEATTVNTTNAALFVDTSDRDTTLQWYDFFDRTESGTSELKYKKPESSDANLLIPVISLTSFVLSVVLNFL